MQSKPRRPKRSKMPKTWTLVAVIVAVALLVGAYFAYADLVTPRPVKIQPVTVSIPSKAGRDSSLNFSPIVLKVVIGVNNTVTWVNNDSVNHTVDATSVPQGAAMFSSNGPIMPRQSFTFTFTVPGDYEYHCQLHPEWMQGAVIVKQ